MKIFNPFFHLFSSQKFKSKIIFIILYITIFTLIVDTSIDRIYYLNFNEYSLTIKMIIFIIIAMISLIGQYAFLQFIRHKNEDIRNIKMLHVHLLSKITYVIQFMLTALFLIMIFQMIIQTQYNVIITIFSTGSSILLGLSMLILLASKFFSWFRIDKNPVVLLYGISSAIIALNIFFAGIITIELLSTKSDIIRPHLGWIYAYSTLGSVSDILSYGYSLSSIAGFVIAWVSTVLLLHQYAVYWKGKAHWIIVSLPLVYFLIQFQPLFLNLFSQFIGSQPILFSVVSTLFITYSKPIGGLIFGSAFWAITRKLHHNGIKMNYTTISAFGFVILFLSNQIILLSSASYPPFGIATINFLGLSCYMVLVGIYSSAISISQNAKLRVAIRKVVENKSNMLDSIGAIQMSQFLEKEVLDIYNNLTDKMHDTVGIKPSLSQEEAKRYCEEVIEELKHKGR
jgi:hypothetical protein